MTPLLDEVDLAVIGGGTAGLSAAQAAQHGGHQVLLVSEGPLGGECTWSGCVPSKALLEAARIRHLAGRAERFGIRIPRVDVDFRAVMERVRAMSWIIGGYEGEDELRRSGITVERGRARFLDAGSIEIGGRRVGFRRAVICTGSRPGLPRMAGLDSVPHLTNETLFELSERPDHLIVLGGGPTGLEMAQAFARLGVSVDVIEAADCLLPSWEPQIARVAQRRLEADGVRFHLGASVTSARHEGGSVILALAGDVQIAGDLLLVAAGRRPVIDELGLDQAGVVAETRGVTVDDHLRTSASAIYAAGDVTGIMPLTHVAAYQGRLAARNAFGGRGRARYEVVPSAIYIDPELARVGLSEAEARERHGDNVRVATLPLTAVDRAVITGEMEGQVTLVTGGRPLIGHAAGGRLLGAQIVGPGAGDLIHEVALAMQVNAFSGRLAQTIHAYPSMSLAIQQAAAQLFAAGRVAAGPMREDLLP